MKDQVVILFGAGASTGAVECNPEKKPQRTPLGIELLSKMHEFNPSLWTSKGYSIESKGRALVPFENEMDKKIDEGFNIVPFQKDMGAYFAGFSAIENAPNAYLSIIRALRGRLNSRKVILSSLNYDILLDRAMLKEFGGKFSYSAEFDGPLLIKPHGSCNMLVHHPNLNIGGEYTHEIKGENHGKLDFPPMPLFLSPELLKDAIMKDKIPPIMRIYATKKLAPIGSSWLDKQQSALKNLIQEASKVIVIGVKVNPADDHIWGEIKRSAADIYLANKDEESSAFILERYGNTNNLINGYLEPSPNDVLKRIIRVTKDVES